MLRLCASDQKHNDGDILATIEGELGMDDDEALSELANSNSLMFDESHVDDGDACHPEQPTSRNGRMLTPPDDSGSGGVAPVTTADSCQPSFTDDSTRLSDVCDSPLASLSCTSRSDAVESQAEETFSSSAAAHEGHNFTHGAFDACSDDTAAGGVDCAVGNTSSSNECDPSALPDDDASETTSSVPEHGNKPVETISDIQSLNSEQLETAGVSCDETTTSSSSVSVMDTSYVVVDSSDVIKSDVDDSLIVVSNVPVPGAESAEHVTSCSADEVLTADVQQNSGGLSDEAVKLELAEAINIEAKKKGFRVRFHEDHVTGYHDPPAPWREGWFGLDVGMGLAGVAVDKSVFLPKTIPFLLSVTLIQSSVTSDWPGGCSLLILLS